MGSIAEISEALTEVLNKRAKHWALETGFIKRVRKFDGADFAQSLIFGWLQEPDLSLEGLCQVLGRREVDLSAPGLFQRFTPEAAEFFQHMLEELSAHRLQAEKAVPTKLLQQFQAVILEDSSIINAAYGTLSHLEGMRRPSRSQRWSGQAVCAVGCAEWASRWSPAD